jgi:hypothetical protein
MAGKFQPAPPRQQPFFDADGKTIAQAWYQWLQLVPPRLTSPAQASPPATSNATGVAGMITFDQNFVYVCIATNTWRRSALAAF